MTTATAQRALARLWHGDADATPPGRARLGIALAVVLALILLPYLFGAYWVGIATIMLIFAVWALSLNVLAGATGLISLGHAGLLGVSAYMVAIAQGRWGWSFGAAAVAALVVTMLVSFVFSLMITRATDVIFLMITLAQGMLVWGLAHRWTSVMGGDNGLSDATRPSVVGSYWVYYWFALAVAVAVTVGLRWFLTSTAGLRLRGIRDSESRMASLGYSVTVQRLIAFNVAGFVAGIAGVMHAGYFQFVSPSTVFLRQSVEGVLMILVGGVGSFLGPVVGAVGIIGARTGLTGVTDRWATVMGLLLILTVLYAPNGLMGHAPQVLERLRGWWDQARSGDEGGHGAPASAPPRDEPADDRAASPVGGRT